MLAKLKEFFFSPPESADNGSLLDEQQRDLSNMSAEIEQLRDELRTGNQSANELERKELQFREELEKILLECHDGLVFPVLLHGEFKLVDCKQSLLRVTADENDSSGGESDHELERSTRVVSFGPVDRPSHRRKLRLYELSAEDFVSSEEWLAWEQYLDLWRKRDAISEHFEKGVLFNMRRQREHLEGKLFQRHIDLLRLEELRRISEVQLREALNAAPRRTVAPVAPAPPPQQHVSMHVNV